MSSRDDPFYNARSSWWLLRALMASWLLLVVPKVAPAGFLKHWLQKTFEGAIFEED